MSPPPVSIVSHVKSVHTFPPRKKVESRRRRKMKG
jgi:hypothetical protein